MENNFTVVYLVSGPLGAGKSTVAKKLSHKLEHAVLIEGDIVMSMFEEGHEPPWDEWLSVTWTNLAALTRNFARKGYHVVIDYVVEQELNWFMEQMADLNVMVKYIVLTASETVLMERLERRGDGHLRERSLTLLNQLQESAGNHNYLYDTTGKQPAEIAKEIVLDSRFFVPNPA